MSKSLKSYNHNSSELDYSNNSEINDSQLNEQQKIKLAIKERIQKYIVL